MKKWRDAKRATDSRSLRKPIIALMISRDDAVVTRPAAVISSTLPDDRVTIAAMSAPADKPEYPPLLPNGRHALSLAELRALCVDPFPLSATRPRIMAGLEAGWRQLHSAGVDGQLS